MLEKLSSSMDFQVENEKLCHGLFCFVFLLLFRHLRTFRTQSCEMFQENQFFEKNVLDFYNFWFKAHLISENRSS